MRNSKFWRSGILFLLLFGFVISLANAQERTVSGKVTSDEGESLPGVNIIIQGTAQGTVTDVNGDYTLEVPGSDAVLVFSSIGFTTQAVPVGDRSTINVVLEQEVTSLEEIVVTAYATQEKKDITGSVSTVNSEELASVPQSNITQQLQGRVSGVTVTEDSRPGQSGTVRIRGFGSFQNNNPLYIVDGVPTTDVSTISDENIESMSVLKDAGAASIYGARASNGVILITTKKGQEKAGINVNYSMYAGTQDPGSGPDNLCTAQEYADLQWLVYDNTGVSEVHPLYGDSNNASPTLPDWAANTNWFDESFRSASIMKHNLSMSGGNADSKFFASFGYLDQEGIVITNWYEKFTARFNSQFTIKDRVTIGENISIAHRADNGVSTQNENSAMTEAVYRSQPIIPVVWNSGTFDGMTKTFENGDWGGTGIAPRLGNKENFVAEETLDKDDVWKDLRVFGNVFVDVKIIEGLNFKTSLGGSRNNWYSTNWTNKTDWNSENTATSTYAEYAGQGFEWTWTNTLTLNRDFGDHNVLAVAGYEAVKTGIGRDLGVQRAEYFSSALAYRTVGNGATLQNGWSSYWTPRSLVSQFLRTDYNFQNKYYISATVRRDGSSVFGPDTRYGIFPSVSAGWRITEESFFAGVGGFIDDLKIRGGYGTMGNQLAVATANQFSLFGGSPSRTYYDLSGTFNSSLQGFRATRTGNPDAKWETNVTTNVGFDATLLDRKFEIIFDWYTKQNVDLLFDPELPGTAGAAAYPYVNVAEMKNNGIDLQMIYRQIWSDFSFEANATFTTYNNEIISIAEGYDFFDTGGSRIGGFNRNMVGHAIGEFFGYKVIGLFKDDAEVSEAPTQDGAEPGFLRFEDNNGTDAEGNLTGEPDGEITPADRTFIGNPNPDFTYGLNLNVSYKNFDLTAFFYGTQGNEIFNYNKWWIDFWPSFQGQKSTDLLYDSWTTENTDATVPKATNSSNFSTNQQSSSYFVEDGSYLRLKNLTLGYTLPENILGGIFSNARIYIQGTNLFTISEYSGEDPSLARIGDTYNVGVDQGSLPIPKQYLIGINLGF